MPTSPPDRDAQERTTADIRADRSADVTPGQQPRLQLERGVEYDRMRGLIESSLFGEPSEPLRIGRFAVLEPVGSGGMGVVYAAYDDVLDRKVAVKVLHGSASAHSGERMLREARAMARLSHPNIVTVHEVGEHQGQIFLAMEFVRGRSLDRWIYEHEQPPPWREVLAVFRRAGRGLAAAHEAGLVHRDFKPHNVVQGEDGTVKVLDFGLAFWSAAGESRPTSDSGSDSVRGEDSITRTGTIVGTPAYMAPEQLRSEPVTPASDQFAFCVSLFEALHGQRPFAGARLEQLMSSVLEGTIRPPPPGSVPAWVRAIVMRGLSPDPAERFESLPALLDALERDPAVARRRWLGGAAVVSVVAGSIGLAAWQWPTPARPCAGVAAALDEVWSDAQRDGVREGFLASGVTYAEDAWVRLQPRLDAYAVEWTEGSAQACRAHEGGRQSDAIFDLRTVCLESRRASLDAVVSLLRHADGGVVEHAVDVLAGLPPIERCGDLEALTATVPPPDDPAQAQVVVGIRERLAAARVQEDAGRFEDAVLLAEQAQAQAQSLDYAPVQAEAALRVGSARAQTARGAGLEQAQAQLDDALYLALGAGHHEVAIEALARRVYVRAELMRLPAERTRDDEPLVRALLRRDPGDARLRWLVANNLAVRYARAGDHSRARALSDEALEHAHSRGDDGLRDAAVVLANRALDALDRNELAAAEADGRAALAIAERMLGPEHPHIPLYLYPVASSLVSRGRHVEARVLFERAVAINEQATPPSPDVAQDLYQLAELSRIRREYGRAEALADRGLVIVGLGDIGSVRLLHARGDARIGQGKIDQGLADHRHALSIAVLHLGDADPDVASSYEAMGGALTRAGRFEDAEQELGRARDILDAVPTDSPLRVPVLDRLGQLHLSAGRSEPARIVLEQALGIMQRTMPPEHPGFAPLRQRLGDAHLLGGELRSARDAYEQAVAGFEAEYDPDHPSLADAQGGLAGLLLRCASEPGRCGILVSEVAPLRSRARSLADAAAQSYAALGPAFEPSATALRATIGQLESP